MAAMESVTCTGPVNIAVIKYWGKRDEKLILPQNSSVSVTLHQDQLRTKTTVAASPDFTKDRIWLNGVEQDIQNKRLQAVIKKVKKKAKEKKKKAAYARRKTRQMKKDGNTEKEEDDQTHSDDSTIPLLDCKLHIVSENNFPTAAGLASSAAGYSCLVYTLAKLFCVKGDLSGIARQGSGSACRSIYGGFVVWDKGSCRMGSDSIARVIEENTHWPELAVLILVKTVEEITHNSSKKIQVSDQTKHTSSTAGMQTTVKTSELLQARLSGIAQKEQLITAAIKNKDFQTFGEITMKESNQLHAVCLDTYPPISYLTDTSHQIIQLVHQYNDLQGEVKVAYTFDAGPNACLFMLDSDVSKFYAYVKQFFLKENGETVLQGIPIREYKLTKDDINSMKVTQQNGSVKYVIHTKPGPGPQVVEESLIDEKGWPKYLKKV